MILMRKTHVLLLFLGIAGAALGATDVEQKGIRLAAEAVVKAQNEIQQSVTLTADRFEIKEIKPLIDPATHQQIAYVAEVAPQGFVVLATESASHPIVAYSFRHHWSEQIDHHSPLLQLLQADYRSRQYRAVQPDRGVAQSAENGSAGPIDNTTGAPILDFQQWPMPGSTPTEGWVTTIWHQNQPFSNFCPVDPETGNRAVVGCTATALAQIVNYHRTVGAMEFGADDRYTTQTRLISIDADSALYDFPSFPRLNGYLSDLSQTYEADEALDDQDLASLCFACGVALNMDYTSSGSGAGVDSADDVLRLDMGYESAEYHGNLVQTDAYHAFYYALQSDMMNGLPALLEIGITAFYNLHAVVCDGYNTNGFYHLNFGWGANQPDAITDAWYYLPPELPAGYRYVLSGIVRISPTALNVAQLVCDTEKIEVPPALVDEPSEAAQFTLRNGGESDLSIFSMVCSEPFLISTTPSGFREALGPFVLSAGEELPLYVLCTPDSIGPFQGTLIVHSSAETAYLNLHVGCYGVPGGGTAIAAGTVSGAWSAAASPYFICGDVTVESNDHLMITPGTEIVVMDRFHLFVPAHAQLLAQGSQEDSICFHAYNPDVGWNGIEFSETGSDDTLAFCIISDARSTYTSEKGGALNIILSSPAILNSTLKHNQGTYGGGIYCWCSSPHVQYCTFYHNESAEVGGALVLEHSSPRIENSLFYGNVANTNGSFFNSNVSAPTFINVTVADNKDAKYMGKFIYLDSLNTVSFHNCILWALGGDNLDIFLNKNNTLEFHYSDLLTTYLNQHWPIVGYPYQKNQVIWGSGNMTVEPQFVHTDSLAYLLPSGSVLVDAGNPDPRHNDREDPDIPGMALWPAQGMVRNDMGAYGGQSVSFVVPVELTAFTATVRGQDIVLHWQTLSESNNYGFDVERCMDRQSFRKIAFLPGMGTTAAAHRYEYVDTDLEAGTYCYRLKQADVDGACEYSDIIEASITTANRFFLADNYPNPFNEHTVIRYELPRAMRVGLSIYNTRGELVRHLVQGRRNAGIHREMWDGKDQWGNAVSSGCYFYQVHTEEFVETKKLLLIR